MGADRDTEVLARDSAEAVLRAFERYRKEFRELTRRAAERHEHQDWRGMQHDARDRLDLYGQEVTRTVGGAREALGAGAPDRAVWARAKRIYAEALADRADFELAETFFNSVARRLFATVGVEPAIEFVDSDYDRPRPGTSPPVFTTYRGGRTTGTLVTDALAGRRVANRPIDFDARRIAEEIETHWRTARGSLPIDAVEVLDPVFYRNKGAYLIGRIRGGDGLIPLVIALVTDGGRIVVDAVLLSEDEASIVFSFTRAYFHVDVDAPHDTIRFLTSIMPIKRVAELYIALGYDKHGKAELYRDLMRHLARSSDMFEIAPGDPGMTMIVFTLPSYDIVFKVIRDRFAPPKTTTRRHVLDRYQLVFRHDRAGRLVDAQEFEHLAFPSSRFSERLLAELTGAAAESVTLDGDRVAITHLYTERRVRPLNLYLREAGTAEARTAVIDYGRAIKDLAATNIFPGDLLLKNFGVTRHGRVIFYDYDELCLLTDCNFRTMPEPRDYDEELAGEPWFYVGPNDMFPEEFLRFMGLLGDLRDTFVEAHRDLLDIAFWRRMQALHRAGEIVDIFPYAEHRRCRPGGPPAISRGGGAARR